MVILCHEDMGNNIMKKHCFFLLSLSMLILYSCTNQLPYSAFQIPKEHYPSEEIKLKDLSIYQIAFCLGMDSNSDKTNQQDGGKVVNLHISLGDRSEELIISTDNLRIHPSPYLAQVPQGHPTDDDVGCIDSSERDIRFNSNELFWRPNNDQIAFVAGTNPSSTDYRLFEVHNDLAYSEKDPPITFHDYDKYFLSPRWVNWSPTSDAFATLGSNDQVGNAGHNIWVYDITAKSLKEVTHFTRPGNDVATATWSHDGKMLAVGYGGPASGIAIVTVQESEKYIEVTSNTHSDLMHPWPHWLTSSWFNLAKGIYYGKDSTENFNGELAFNSSPVWVNNDQQVIFVGANTRGKASLFVVNAGGTNLHELLPGLPGITLMPRISPDGRLLAFARFPDWNDRSRVEIATLDLSSMRVQSLAVFPKLPDGSIMFVSGVDWSPDSRYLAFSVPYKDKSDIFIVSNDGKSFIDFTESQKGDAVSPAWRP